MNYLWDNLFRRSNKKEDAVRFALRENILFKDLSDRELRSVEGIVHVRKFHGGEPVFRQGEVGIGMYIIISGRVDIYVTDEAAVLDEGKDIFITQLLPGDFFGELALVEENGRRTATAIAREETVVVGFFKPDLDEILKLSPSAGIKVLFRLGEVLGRRLKETTNKVSELRRALKDLSEPPPTEARNASKASSPLGT